MKSSILILIFFLSNTILISQSLEINYLQKEKIDSSAVDKTEMSDLLRKQYFQLKKERSKMEKYFVLEYIDGKSVYTFLKVVNARPYMTMSKTITYKDLQDGYIYTTGGMLMSSEAIRRNIKDDFQWEYTNETKEIAGYNCFKAIHTNEHQQKTDAWYTTEIPIADGPSIYAGLPGLILQLESKSYILSVLNIEEIADASKKINIPEFTQFTNHNDYRKSILSTYQKN